MPLITQPHVIYNLTEHCNLSCYGCDHNSPVMAKRFADPAEFERDLTALATAMRVGSVYFVGGEPLLHPELPVFLQIARDVGIARRAGIVTNGVLLHEMSEQAWALCDVIHLTHYPGVRVRFTDEALIARCRERNIALRIENVEEFRITIINDVIDDPALVQTLYDACRIAHVYRCRTIYGGRYYKCSPAPFIPRRLQTVGKGDAAAGWLEADGVALRDNPMLYDQLVTYLDSATPLASCAACLGTSGQLAEHRQMNQRARAAWLREDHGRPEQLLDPAYLIRHRDRETGMPDRTHKPVFSSEHLFIP